MVGFLLYFFIFYPNFIYLGLFLGAYHSLIRNAPIQQIVGASFFLVLVLVNEKYSSLNSLEIYFPKVTNKTVRVVYLKSNKKKTTTYSSYAHFAPSALQEIWKTTDSHTYIFAVLSVGQVQKQSIQPSSQPVVATLSFANTNTHHTENVWAQIIVYASKYICTIDNFVVWSEYIRNGPTNKSIVEANRIVWCSK